MNKNLLTLQSSIDIINEGIKNRYASKFEINPFSDSYTDIRYHENGQKKFEGNYSNSVLYGVFIIYHDNGIICIITNLFNNNHISTTQSVVGDEIVEENKFYRNGNLRCEYNYKNGTKSGACIHYYKSGVIKIKKYINLYDIRYYHNRYKCGLYKNKKFLFF